MRWIRFFALILILGLFFCKKNMQVIDKHVGYPEGPSWIKDKLFYVSYGSDEVRVWDGKEVSSFWKPDDKCGPASLIERSNGNLLVSCYDKNSLVELDPSGNRIKAYLKTIDGKSFTGPNDFVRDADGGIYFSASGVFELDAPVSGKIFYMNTKDEITEASPGILFHYSNGLAIIEGGKKLLVNEHLKNKITSLDILEKGKLGNPNTFADLEKIAPKPKTEEKKLGPDGMKAGKSGNLYVCQYAGGRVLVLDGNGNYKKEIPLPNLFVTNIAFKEEDESSLYLTIESNANSADMKYSGKVIKVRN